MKKPNVNPNNLYEIPSACKALGVDRRTLRRYTQAGVLPCHIRRADGRIVYFGSDLLACYYAVE